MSTACLTAVPQLHGPYLRRASPTGHGRVFYAVTAFKSNTPRISWVAASASRSFSLSCALSRWPSARSGRGLEAFLQLCALTANTVDTPGQSGNVAAGSELRHQTRA